MRIQDHIAAAMISNLGMLERTLGDFSDADMLVRPVPNANHAAWQVGHLICSDTRLAQAVGAETGAGVGVEPLPQAVMDKFTRDTASAAAGFPTKAELLALYRRQREAISAWAKSLSDAGLDAPTPERLQRLAPTAGALLLFLPTHLAMHTGQLQVIRRALGKPVLM